MPQQAAPAAGLGQFLRDHRERIGYTTTDLAATIGVHQTTISKWELGRGLRSIPQYASKLAAALQVEVEDVQRLWWDEMGGYLTPISTAA